MKPKTAEHTQPQPPATDRKDTILVVDDVAANIDILLEALADEYSVSVALDGPTALKSVKAVVPDLILLDIMMPGMDGYEVCTKLKANPATQEIPVIFLTALNEEADEEKGLRLGAVDYISKPFNPALVKARVRNHLAMHAARIEALHQRDQMEAAYKKLKELEKLRDDLVHMIVHDLRSPLTGIRCFLDLLSPEELDRPDFQQFLSETRITAGELCDMVSALLDVSRLEAREMPLNLEDKDLGPLIQTVLQRMGSLIHGRPISVHAPDQPVRAFCDTEITRRILQNLLGNALKFTPPEGCIRIELELEEQCARISVIDTGPGIPAKYHEKVFQKFGQVEARKEGQMPSTGLGLTFCKLAVEAQGGSIQLESDAGQGTAFHVRLPRRATGA